MPFWATPSGRSTLTLCKLWSSGTKWTKKLWFVTFETTKSYGNWKRRAQSAFEMVLTAGAYSGTWRLYIVWRTDFLGQTKEGSDQTLLPHGYDRCPGGDDRTVDSSCQTGGRPRRVDMRAVINGIFYIVRTGCAWRMLPKEYPPWETVYYYFHCLYDVFCFIFNGGRRLRFF